MSDLKSSPLLRSASKVAFAASDLVHRAPSGPRILIYHQVGVENGRQMEVPTATFARQLDWLREHHRVVDLDTALERRASDADGAPVVLTFDDGYRDTFENAFPLMVEREMPFTLYVCTEHIETGVPLDPHVPHGDPLHWGMIREMMAYPGFTIGAHTHAHTDVRSLDGHGVQLEVDHSDALFEERLGVRPDHFAYPWGHWAGDADEVVRRRYRSAVLGSIHEVDPATDPFLQVRYPVQLSDGFFFFKRRLRGGLLAEEWLRRRLSGYDGP